MSKPIYQLSHRLPAEWETHQATWIAWPHHTPDWPGKSTPIPWVYGEIVRKLAPGEIVRILVNSKDHEARARRILERVGVPNDRVEFFRFSTNRGWTRDFGPLFVERKLKLLKPGEKKKQRKVFRKKIEAMDKREITRKTDPWAIAGFQFNAWAKYPDFKKDKRIAERAARAIGLRMAKVKHRGEPVVLEGGSIDVNGRGTLITTEECLLDQNVQVRNPGYTKEDYAEIFRFYLGVKNIIWLGKGIFGDDTHGHVDDLARFVNHKTIVICEEKNPADANYRPLKENKERLQNSRLEDGSKPTVVTLPMPKRLQFGGMRLPASYANFYIGNAAVIVPTFNDPEDRVALGILAELFPHKPVVGIHAVDLVWGLGTLHCLTMQQPKMKLPVVG